MQWHHPVSQQRLKREFRYGAYRAKFFGGWSSWKPLARGERGVSAQEAGAPVEVQHRSLRMILRDIRNRQWVCLRHHGNVEQRILKFDRSELDATVEEFAAEFGMIWSLDRDYGPRGDGDGEVPQEAG